MDVDEGLILRPGRGRHVGRAVARFRRRKLYRQLRLHAQLDRPDHLHGDIHAFQRLSRLQHDVPRLVPQRRARGIGRGVAQAVVLLGRRIARIRHWNGVELLAGRHHVPSRRHAEQPEAALVVGPRPAPRRPAQLASRELPPQRLDVRLRQRLAVRARHRPRDHAQPRQADRQVRDLLARAQRQHPPLGKRPAGAVGHRPIAAPRDFNAVLARRERPQQESSVAIRRRQAPDIVVSLDMDFDARPVQRRAGRRVYHPSGDRAGPGVLRAPGRQQEHHHRG
jgi:hypothetical protein